MAPGRDIAQDAGGERLGPGDRSGRGAPGRPRRALRQRARAVALAVALASACRPAPSNPRAPAAPVSLTFVDDFNVPRSSGTPRGTSTPRAAWDAMLGGLSGLHYDARERVLYALSDDSRYAPPRLYTFGVQLTASNLQVVPRSVVLLHSPTESLVDLDAESITGDARGSLFVGTEGHHERTSRPSTRVLRIDREGTVIASLPVPPHFWSDSGAASGGRSNLGIEGLTVSPSGRWLTAIHEAALLQDGPLADFDHGTLVRILRWELNASAPPRELSYRTERVARDDSAASPRSWHNGVSALLALDDSRLLVLERAYVATVEGRGYNTVRLFEVRVDEVSPGASTRATAPRPLQKHLVLDLQDIVPKLEPGLQRLDNLEGMTLGPRLPSGERSLILVSDDNFNENQRTVFLALRLIE